MASTSPSAPAAAAPPSQGNSSSLSISDALSSTPTESPLLDDSPSPDDDAALALAAQKGRRRSSLQAPGLIQYAPPTSFLAPTTQATIPGSPTLEDHQLPPTTSTSAGAGAGEQPNKVGQGAELLVEFLLVSGKRTRWTVGDQATVREVREAVWRGWPQEWRGQEESPPSAESLRLLYLGKFLDDKRTLGFYGLTPPPPAPASSAPTGTSPSSPGAPPLPPAAAAPTIIHLNIRPLATEGEYEDDLLKPQKPSSACGVCCIVC